MDWLWYVLISVVSGVFAGMGMGGGTFLIPLLTLLMSMPQTQAQAQNLVVFVPMAVVVGIIYSCQKLVDWKRAWLVALTATIVATIGALVAIRLSGKVLKIVFGCFVAAVGVWQFVVVIIDVVKDKKCKKTKICRPAIKTEKEI